MAESMGLDLGRHRDLSGRARQPWVRRGLVAMLALLPLLALLNVFGQRTSTQSARGGGATLIVTAPEALRGGLLFQARIQVTADRPIAHPVLALDGGWLSGLTLNTIEPAASNQGWRDGALRLSYPPIAKGGSLVVYLEYQVNPTTVTRRARTASLLDGSNQLVSLSDTITVFP
jgi:hypothetical protein